MNINLNFMNPFVEGGGMSIKVFADGADIEGMLDMYREGNVQGFTTNPSLMKKGGVTDYRAFAKEVLSQIKDLPVSFEVFADDFEGMEAEARMMPRSVGPDPEFLGLMPDYLEGVSLRSLAVICADLASRRDTFLLEAEHVAPRRLPVALTVASVDRVMRARGHATFSELLDGQSTPELVVATFLAILELFKLGMVTVSQAHTFGEIDITHIEGADAYVLDESALTGDI